ncbi:MAG TPA: MMPL family transporter [Bacillales bacterium]|nr:MMPL family transporter [Bacillales bacterium]
MKRFFANWGSKTAGPKGRWITLLIWIIAVAVLSMIWPSVNKEETNSNALLPDDAMSVKASHIADEQFADGTGNPLLLVWERDEGLSRADYQTVHRLYEQLEKNPLPGQSFIPPLGQIPAEALIKSASKDGEALTTPVFFNKKASVETLQKAIDQLKNRMNEEMNQNPFTKKLSSDGLHVRLTGPVGIQTDATALFSQADVTLLIATTLLVLILLILLYRSPLMAIVPLIGVGFAYGAISPILGFMASQGWITYGAQAISIMTVLLFGAGTDYCLFLVSRYREELQEERSKYQALRLAVKGAGGAIAMSAMTVILGLLTLLLARYGSFERFAVPFSLAILIMGIAALTLLPALLSIFGRISFYPFIPRTEGMAKELEEKKGKPVRRPKSSSRLSRGVGRWVTQKPWTIIIGCIIVLGGLASFSTKIEYSYGLLDSFPETMPSREGFAIISHHFPAGELAPVQVIVDNDGKETTIRKQLKALPFVKDVSGPKKGEKNPEVQQYQVTLSMDPYSPAAIEKIPKIKQVTKQGLEKAGVNNATHQVWVGGETASLYDTKQVTSRDESVIIPVVILIIAILLLLYLRSLVAMAYLLATVLLSYFAALGTGWLMIHFGYGSDAMQGLIPLYSFVFLVALGEDYNIFMISSIWSKRKRLSLKKAIFGGVIQTGSVITSAGLILAGTFAVLAVLPLQVLVQFGTVTAIGVLLDTFIVRPLLVPAITTVLGRFAFWPGKLWKKHEEDRG